MCVEAAGMQAREATRVFRVKICGKVLERECTWSEIERFKERVKKFCKWHPQERLWDASVEELLKYSAEALKTFKEIFNSESEKLIIELLRKDKEIRDREIDNGKLIILPVEGCSFCWQLLRRYARKRTITIECWPVNYYELDIEAALETVVEWGAEPEKSASALLELLAHLDPALTAKQQDFVKQRAEQLIGQDNAATLVEWGMRGALIILPKTVGEDLVIRLQSELSVDYYRQVMSANGIELVPTKLRLVKNLSGRVVKVPYFAVPIAARFLEKSNLQVVEKINWPLTPSLSPTPRFTLYSFQEEALNAWRRAGRRGTIVMPTGAGKTFVALAAIAELKVPTLVCVTTVELAKQWVRRVYECLGLRAGILAGGEKRIEPLTVATYHSAVKALPEIYGRFGFIVFDEGHHVPARTFKEIALRAKARYVIVLSATPERSDKNEALIYKMCGEPVYSTSYYELVVRGLLAPLKVEVIPVQLDAEETARYMEASGADTDYRRVTELIRIASCAKAKLEALKTIVRSEKGKILVFCQYVEQALKAYEAVREVEPRTALITGSTPKGERLRSFESFKNGSLRVLVATSVLDEGIDVPDADVAIILSGTGQVRQMVQRVGRVLRWTPGKVAKVYEIISSGTIEEALSRSRSVFKAMNRAEVEAALEVATAAYERMSDAISKFASADRAEKERVLEEVRGLYVKLAAELAAKRSLLRFQ
ncbi:MAG: DEAD/DEAH box helicase [Thermofilaceae archaeon]